jgi:hypothetical protein
MSANIKASLDGTQAIIGVGGVDQMTVSNAGVVTANSFVGLNSSSVTATGSTTARTLANRFADVVNVKDFGAVGNGVTDDTAAIQDAEASTYTYIDLAGCNIITTLTESQISKYYFNGTLSYQTSEGNAVYVKTISPLADTEVQRPRTKSPRIDWKDKRILWLGTSIPHEGGNIDGYPILFAKSLNATTDNLAWAGSHSCYDVDGDAFEIGTIKALSMTEDDRLAGLALYGPTSAYDDSFDLITKASRMTCDYRIKDQFIANSYDCVMLDHNHNDRTRGFGILNPTTTAITSVTIGVTTTFTSVGHGLAVGDAVILRISGITNLDYASGRVQSISGNDFVLNINSSGYIGTFTSGTVAKVDRDTLCGAWNFLISYIKNCIILYGNSHCNIVLSGAPNEYTAGNTKPYEVYSNAFYLKQIAEKWDLSFFDIGFYYDINPHDEPVYFPDGFHPTTLESRQSLANYWVNWAQGGASNKVDETDFLPTGEIKTFNEQREALYSKYINGFGTPNFIISGSTNLINDSFSSLTGWGTVGTPTSITAPWGSGNAVQFNVASATTEYIQRNVVFSNGTKIEFDLYIPVTQGLTTGVPKTINILNQRIQPISVSSSSTNAGIQLIVRENNANVRGFMFDSSGGINYLPITYNIQPATKYKIKLEIIQGTSIYKGACLMYIDNIYISGVFDITNYISLPQSIRLGINSNNMGAFEAYIGNLIVDSLGVYDYTNRFTGTFISSDIPSKTINVVNGIIVSAS